MSRLVCLSLVAFWLEFWFRLILGTVSQTVMLFVRWSAVCDFLLTYCLCLVLLVFDILDHLVATFVRLYTLDHLVATFVFW